MAGDSLSHLVPSVWLVLIRLTLGGILGLLGYLAGKRNSTRSQLCAAALVGLVVVALRLSLLSFDLEDGWLKPYPADYFRLLLNAWNSLLPIALGWYIGRQKARRKRLRLRSFVAILVLFLLFSLGWQAHFRPYAELLDAAQNGDAALAERALRAGVDPNFEVGQGSTPLHFAWREGHRDVFRVLLEHGADINRPGYIVHHRPDTILSFAARLSPVEDVEYLLENGARWDNDDLWFGCPLTTAIEASRVEIVEVLLQHGDISKPNWTQFRSPFRSAAAAADAETLDVLLRGVDWSGVATPDREMVLGSLVARCEQPGLMGVLMHFLDSGWRPVPHPSHKDNPFHGLQGIEDERVRELVMCVLLERGGYPNRKLSPQRGSGVLDYPAAVLAFLRHSKPPRKGAKDEWSAHTLALAALEREDPARLLARVDEEGLVGVAGEYGFTLLHAAASLGSAELVAGLLSAGAEPQAESAIGETPLHACARWGQRPAAEILVEAGADIDSQDCFGETPLHAASRNRRDEFADWLKRLGADLSVRDVWGKKAGDAVIFEPLSPKELAAVMRMIDAGDVDALRAEIDDGLDVDTVALRQDSLLHHAVRSGHPECVALLLERGALVNTMACPGRFTPLHLAADVGQVPSAEILIDAGVPTDISDMYGRTPLHSAVLGSRPKMVDFLCRAGANTGRMGRSKQSFSEAAPTYTPLELAVRVISYPEHEQAIVSTLLAYGAQPEGATMEAASALNIDALRTLLPHVDSQRILNTALYRAISSPKARRGRDRVKAAEATRALVEAGADPNAISVGDTPLVAAINQGNLPAVETLLALGADPNLPCHGDSPLRCAIHNRESEIADFLRRHGAADNPNPHFKRHPSDGHGSARERETQEVEHTIVLRVKGKGSVVVHQKAHPRPGWTFIEWQDMRGGSPTTLSENPELRFRGADGFTLSRSKGGYVSATVIPEADAGWRFDHWEGEIPAGAGVDDAEFVLMPDKKRTITAVFVEKQNPE